MKRRINDVDGNLEDLTKLTIESYERLMDDLKITEAIVQVNELVNRANKYIDETEPWALAKDPEKKANLESVMVHLANTIYVAGMLILHARCLGFLGRGAVDDGPVDIHLSKDLTEHLGCYISGSEDHWRF